MTEWPSPSVILTPLPLHHPIKPNKITDLTLDIETLVQNIPKIKNTMVTIKKTKEQVDKEFSFSYYATNIHKTSADCRRISVNEKTIKSISCFLSIVYIMH
jgi:hypothetical protein